MVKEFLKGQTIIPLENIILYGIDDFFVKGNVVIDFKLAPYLGDTLVELLSNHKNIFNIEVFHDINEVGDFNYHYIKFIGYDENMHPNHPILDELKYDSTDTYKDILMNGLFTYLFHDKPFYVRVDTNNPLSLYVMLLREVLQFSFKLVEEDVINGINLVTLIDRDTELETWKLHDNFADYVDYVQAKVEQLKTLNYNHVLHGNHNSEKSVNITFLK